jgi:hypothetical protein
VCAHVFFSKFQFYFHWYLCSNTSWLHTHPLTLTHAHIHSHMPPYACSPTNTHRPTHAHSHTLIHTHSHTHSHTVSLVCSAYQFLSQAAHSEDANWMYLWCLGTTKVTIVLSDTSFAFRCGSSYAYCVKGRGLFSNTNVTTYKYNECHTYN